LKEESMTAKTSRSTTGETTGIASLAQLGPLADLPRQQMALITQSASALLRASESVRKVQQQAAHRASAQHQDIAERLRAPCDFGELMAIQSELLRFNMQEAAQYWQQIATAAFRAQADLVGSAGEAIGAAGGEPTLDSLQKAFAASLTGSAGATNAAH
jgi:DNA-binding transcriptional regulator/RsmH inhibitor MraZ